MKLMPRSKADLMRSVTPSWLTPATVAHMPSPLPKVIAPRHISETISPVFPSFLNRMVSLHFVTHRVCARPFRAVSATQVDIPHRTPLIDWRPFRMCAGGRHVHRLGQDHQAQE